MGQHCRPEPHIEIIILTWNGKDDTLACLQTVRKLNYSNYHVIVVDNGSVDGSVDAIKSAYKEESWLTVIDNGKNLGYTGGNNVGIRHALDRDACYVWLLNNDTKVAGDALSRLVQAAEADPKAGLLGPKILQMDRPNLAYAMRGSLNLWFPWPDRMEGEEGAKVGGNAMEVDFLSGAALLARREFVEEVGLLDERFFFYWEEIDWCERGRKAGFRSVLVPEAVVHHKGGGSSGKGWNPFTAYYLVRNWILFMRKHARPVHWVTFLPFLFASLCFWTVKALLHGNVAVARAFFSAVVWHLKTPVNRSER